MERGRRPGGKCNASQIAANHPPIGLKSRQQQGIFWSAALFNNDLLSPLQALGFGKGRRLARVASYPTKKAVAAMTWRRLGAMV